MVYMCAAVPVYALRCATALSHLRFGADFDYAAFSPLLSFEEWVGARLGHSYWYRALIIWVLSLN